MPNYHIYLKPYDGDAGEDFDQIVAEDDEEARSLAELRLLMTRGVAGVVVLRSGVELLRLNRDDICDVESAAPPVTGPAGREGRS